MNRVLALAGRHGPTLLFFGVTIGFVFPALALWAKPLMGVAVFVFSLGAFLKVDGDAFRAEFRQPGRVITVLVWVSIGVPALAWAFVSAMGFSTDMRLGIMLCMLGPPVGSAAAMASMLGLNAALALVVTIAISLLAPLYLPPIVALIGGSTTHIDVIEMLRRIVAVIGTAAGAALLLRRFAGKPRQTSSDPNSCLATTSRLTKYLSLAWSWTALINTRPTLPIALQDSTNCS